MTLSRRRKRSKVQEDSLEEAIPPSSDVQVTTSTTSAGGVNAGITDVDVASSLALQSMTAGSSAADDPASDLSEDSEAETMPLSRDAQLHARTFAVLASSWLSLSAGDVRPVMDTFLPRIVPLVQPGLPMEAVFGLFQVLRHVLGFLAVARSGSPEPDDTAVGEGVQLVMQLLLRLALLYGCDGWDQDSRRKRGCGGTEEVDRMLELAASNDPELRSIWYSLASNEPSATGVPVWTAMVDLLGARVAEVKTRIEASPIDYITFVIAVRQIQHQSSTRGTHARALQNLRLACGNCPQLLATAMRQETSPALAQLTKRLGPQPGPQALGNYLLNDAPLEECWALQQLFSGAEASKHSNVFVADSHGDKESPVPQEKRRRKQRGSRT